MFMNNKILLLALILTFSSCSIFQNTKTFTQDIDSSAIESNDVLQKFLGTYEIEVFNLPDGGDGKFSMKVTKEGDALKTTFTTEEASQTIDIVGTEVEEGILYIDIYIKSYGINTAFEIYVEGDQVTGYLADMFELQGVKYPLIESDENIPKNISSLISGDYTITLYDVPSYGEIDARIKIFFKKNILNSEVSYFNGESWVDVTVNSTEVEDEAVFISVVDAEAGGNVDLEVYFDDQNSISGFYAGLFEFSGKRLK